MRTNCLGTALSNQGHSLRHIKKEKRIGRSTVTRVTTVKGMKRRVAERQVAEEWNFHKCGVRPIHKHRSSAKETSL
jgi:hypothetical protein